MITLSITGLEKIDGAKGNAGKVLTAALDEAVMFLVREIKLRTPQGVGGAQGGLLGSIQGDVEARGSILARGVIASNSHYGLVVEKGRRAGAAMPPREELVEWIAQKFGVDEEQARKLSWPVARAIAQKGTIKRFGYDGAHMFERAVDENIPALREIFRRNALEMIVEKS
jgi:hypothetical protein